MNQKKYIAKNIIEKYITKLKWVIFILLSENNIGKIPRRDISLTRCAKIAFPLNPKKSNKPNITNAAPFFCTLEKVFHLTTLNNIIIPCARALELKILTDPESETGNNIFNEIGKRLLIFLKTTSTKKTIANELKMMLTGFLFNRKNTAINEL